MSQDDVTRRIVTGCSISTALEAVGERWSFLILRGAFSGLSHFEQFQSTLGIARNILANRLCRLVAHGLLERCPCEDDRRKVEYRLTEKGAALLPALVALRQWGERFGSGPCNTRLVDARDGRPVAPIEVRSADGRVLSLDQVRFVVEDEAEADEPAPLLRQAAG